MTSIATDLLIPELQLGYRERAWSLPDFGRLFVHLEALWSASRDIEYTELPGWAPGIGVVPRVRPRVQTVRLESPLWLELLFEGVAAGAGGTGLHLLVKILRDPTRVAEWLPTFVERWHAKWADAERARVDHLQAQRSRLAEMTKHVEKLAELADNMAESPVFVQLLGGGPEPVELRDIGPDGS